LAEFIQFPLLAKLKALHLNLGDTIRYWWEHIKEFSADTSQIPSYANSFISAVSATVSIVSTVVVSESITQVLKNDRFKTYLAVTVASALNYFPVAFFGASQFALVFVYIRELVNK